MTHWWQSGIVYQIYPRSFQDSNGDGIGDLPGIRQRLDYLHWLGVNAIWISPVYPSPMADFGYDVSDYRAIHPLFGSLADMDSLIAAAHQRQIKVILDFVPNHTSDQHPWFLASRSARDNPRRDWYIWRDAAPDGGPPNNWLSRFDGKAGWTWDAPTGQYYLHTFLKEQPDLNWRNPELRQAMLDVMRFWFDRGVDGFRVDVAYRVLKDAQFRNNPPNPNWQPGMDPFHRLIDKYNRNIPEIHQFNRWLRQVADAYPGRVLIGEINLPLPQLVQHYGQGDEFHLPFNFSLIHTAWTATAVRALADQYEGLLAASAAWPNWVLGNHDQHRVATRLGPAQARTAMLLLLTLRGTPTLYYGDELGMADVPIPPDQVQDPWELYVPGQGLGRDPERTPMQWDGSANAGFCPAGVTPWLPLANSYETVNVARQQDEPASMLALSQALIHLRQRTPALNRGSYQSLDTPAGLLAYLRRHDEESYLVVLNFTADVCHWQLPAGVTPQAILLSTHMDQPTALAGSSLHLRPNEGLVLRI